MSTSIFGSATAIAALAGARRPDWGTGRLSSALALAPVAANEGWLLNDAVYAHLHVTCRELPGSRVAYVSVPVFDASTTYRVIINGTTYTTTPKASLELVLADIVSQADALDGITAAAAPAGTDAGGRTHTNAVRIVGARSINVSASSGTGTIAVVADAVAARVQLYALQTARLGSTAPRAWVAYGDPIDVGPDGHTTLVRVGGLERLAARVWTSKDVADGLAITTTALITLGPALSE